MKAKNRTGSTSPASAKKAKKSLPTIAPFQLSKTVQDPKVKEAFFTEWARSEDVSGIEDVVYSGGDLTLIKHPFKCCVVKNLFDGQTHECLEEVADVLTTSLEFKQKNNDLYKFANTSDLNIEGHRIQRAVSSLKDFLSKQAKPWLMEVTGIDLNETIDMFCAKYRYTDHLLCHDDELLGRRIAYIIYFVPPWTEEDGGTLDLFDVDDKGCPRNVVRSLLPSMNSMAFFEVTPKSFHQVAEVLSESKVRLSIGGWFHGKPLERPQRYLEPKHPTGKLCFDPHDIDKDEFYSWINPQYLDTATQAEIRKRFEDNSEISLANFLQPEKFEAVAEAFRKLPPDVWKCRGPSNRRCYQHLPGLENDEASTDEHSSLLLACIRLMTSDAVMILLSSITGLKLHPLALVDEEDDDDSEESEDEAQNNQTEDVSSKGPMCKFECRRWKRGSYTLLHDHDREQEYSLDARLFFNCKDWSIECGGYTSYVAKDEDEELLTASPEDNTLTLVYKDLETLRFVKYVSAEINRQMPKGEFHDLAITFYE